MEVAPPVIKTSPYAVRGPIWSQQGAVNQFGCPPTGVATPCHGGAGMSGAGMSGGMSGAHGMGGGMSSGMSGAHGMSSGVGGGMGGGMALNAGMLSIGNSMDGNYSSGKPMYGGGGNQCGPCARPSHGVESRFP